MLKLTHTHTRAYTYTPTSVGRPNGLDLRWNAVYLRTEVSLRPGPTDRPFVVQRRDSQLLLLPVTHYWSLVD